MVFQMTAAKTISSSMRSDTLSLAREKSFDAELADANSVQQSEKPNSPKKVDRIHQFGLGRTPQSKSSQSKQGNESAVWSRFDRWWKAGMGVALVTIQWARKFIGSVYSKAMALINSFGKSSPKSKDLEKKLAAVRDNPTESNKQAAEQAIEDAEAPDAPADTFWNPGNIGRKNR